MVSQSLQPKEALFSRRSLSYKQTDNKIHPSITTNDETPTTSSSSTITNYRQTPGSSNALKESVDSSTLSKKLSSRASLSSDTFSSYDDLFSNHEKKSRIKRLLKECCPAIHSLQNMLFVIFLLQTAICIGSLLILTYSSGEQSISNIAEIRERNIVNRITSYMDESATVLASLRDGFLVQKMDKLTTFPVTYVPVCERINTILVPTKKSFHSSTVLYYGNTVKNYCAVEKSSSRDFLQIRDDSSNVLIYTHDVNFEPLSLNQTTKNYDPTTRPWYKAGAKQIYPNYSWSEVFNNAFLGCIAIGAATTLEFNSFRTLQLANGTTIIENVTHVVGAHFDLYNIDSILKETIEQNKDMQTKSIDILIIERSGLVIASSMNVVSKNSYGIRNHISNITLFTEASKILENRKVIYPMPVAALNGTSSISLEIIYSYLNLVDPDLSTFFINEYKYSIHIINDKHGLDWVLLVSTVDYGFIKTIFTSSPLLLSISIILIIFGSIIMIIVTQFITRSIWKVSRDMFKISKLEVDEVKSSKLLKSMYELDLLQTSIKTVKNGLHSFMKFIPRDIVRDIVRTGNSAKLGMANCSSSILFTDLADFTSFSESCSLTILLKILTEYFNIVTESVEKNDGVLDKYIGDGSMSIFSHPLKTVPDHALKATRAAMTCLFRIEQYKILCQKENLPLVRIRIGINTGNCLIGNIGSRDRYNFTAIGDTVNTAGRLEMLNKRYETDILIGNNSYEIVKGKYACVFVDTVKLKGKSKPTEVYTVDGEWDEITPAQKIVQEQLLRVRDSICDKKYQEALDSIDNILELNNMWKDSTNIGETVKDYSSVKYIVDLRKRVSTLARQSGENDYSLTLTEK